MRGTVRQVSGTRAIPPTGHVDMGGGAFAKLCMFCSPLFPSSFFSYLSFLPYLLLSSPFSFPLPRLPLPCSPPAPFPFLSPSLRRRGLRLSFRSGPGEAKRLLMHFQSKSKHSVDCNLSNSFTFTFIFLYIFVSWK